MPLCPEEMRCGFGTTKNGSESIGYVAEIRILPTSAVQKGVDLEVIYDN